MTFDELYTQARANWEPLYDSQITHVLIGTATCGRAAGAMAVLDAFKQGIAGLTMPLRISEVGCIGMCSYEPLVIILKPGDFAVCYHNVMPQLVPQLIEGYIKGDDPCLDLALGTVAGGGSEAVYIPELERFNHETRLLLRNCGYNSPLDIDHYIACGGYKGLEKSLHVKPAAIIKEVEKSGLRGRGGAGFPTAAKWKVCARARNKTKFVICNADEGDPGAFMDRVLLESDPQAVIEGLCIAGYSVGAGRGFV
jgi:(2Fe-2S) ferredoxin